jgi:hypothetical protein
MAIRNEWTEWHLTPGGWQKGSTRVQGQGNTWLDEPEDRVLSYMYKEVQGASAALPTATWEETWRSKTVTDVDIEELLRLNGPAPRQL